MGNWYIILFGLVVSSTFAQDVTEKQKLTVGKPERYVIFPVIVKSPEYRWGGGVAGSYFFKLKRDSITRTSNFKGASFFTLRKQFVFATEGYVYFPKEHYILHTTASFSHFPDKFWGIGNETEAAALEKYAITQYGFYPQLIRQLYARIYAGIGYEFQNVFRFDYNHSGNSLFDQQDVFGRNGSRASGTGIVLAWDSRNNAFSPSLGFYCQYFINVYSRGIGSDYNFMVQNLDVRKYFPLTNSQVLAMQLILFSTKGDVPIRSLTNIGSNSYMRGYYEGRYTDKDMIAFQTEWRTHVYRKFGMVLFGGAGRVGRQIGDLFVMKHLKPSAGFGVRYALNKKEKLNLRVDSGFGRKSQGSYINVGEAF